MKKVAATALSPLLLMLAAPAQADTLVDNVEGIAVDESGQVSRFSALWIEATMVQMRSELIATEGEPWVTDFDTHDRHEKRILGRRMMELVLQFVSRDDCDAVILSEARAMGAGYAASAQTAGMSVTTALSAILFFRDALTQTIFDLPDTIHVSAHEQRRLLGRMSHLLDKVELAIVETYDSDRQHLN